MPIIFILNVLSGFRNTFKESYEIHITTAAAIASTFYLANNISQKQKFGPNQTGIAFVLQMRPSPLDAH